MDKKNNVNELNMDLTTYEKVKGKLRPDEKKDTTITGEKPPVNTSSTSVSPTSVTSSSTYSPQSMTETGEATAPTPMMIKYLSNVKDSKTGKISAPFMIGDKRYQMVRGTTPTKEVVMGVMCHDELDESGENRIHPIDEFEKTIAQPMKEKVEMVGQDIQVAEKPAAKPAPAPEAVKNTSATGVKTLSEFKHFVLNNKTGRVRKFREIEELAKANMNDDESYMNLHQFKKHAMEKLFGKRSKKLSEVSPTGVEDDAQMSIKAKELIDMIRKSVPSNIIATIQTPVAKREVIAAFAEMLGVHRNQLENLISGLKDMAVAEPTAVDGAPQAAPAAPAPQSGPVTEGRKVIKTVKVKELK